MKGLTHRRHEISKKFFLLVLDFVHSNLLADALILVEFSVLVSW